MAIATAQSVGINLSLTQLNQIQARSTQLLMVLSKTNVQDYAYLGVCLDCAADTDLTSALQSVPKLVQGVPKTCKKYIYRTVGYIVYNSH